MGFVEPELKPERPASCWERWTSCELCPSLEPGDWGEPRASEDKSGVKVCPGPQHSSSSPQVFLDLASSSKGGRGWRSGEGPDKYRCAPCKTQGTLPALLAAGGAVVTALCLVILLGGGEALFKVDPANFRDTCFGCNHDYLVFVNLCVMQRAPAGQLPFGGAAFERLQAPEGGAKKGLDVKDVRLPDISTVDTQLVAYAQHQRAYVTEVNRTLLLCKPCQIRVHRQMHVYV
jgi:hypothetical protein